MPATLRKYTLLITPIQLHHNCGVGGHEFSAKLEENDEYFSEIVTINYKIGTNMTLTLVFYPNIMCTLYTIYHISENQQNRTTDASVCHIILAQLTLIMYLFYLFEHIRVF